MDNEMVNQNKLLLTDEWLASLIESVKSSLVNGVPVKETMIVERTNGDIESYVIEDPTPELAWMVGFSAQTEGTPGATAIALVVDTKAEEPQYEFDPVESDSLWFVVQDIDGYGATLTTVDYTVLDGAYVFADASSVQEGGNSAFIDFFYRGMVDACKTELDATEWLGGAKKEDAGEP